MVLGHFSYVVLGLAIIALVGFIALEIQVWLIATEIRKTHKTNPVRDATDINYRHWSNGGNQ